MNKVIIYSLSDPVSGVVKYIGQTSKTLNERIKSHLKDANYKKNNKRIAWINSLTKKGKIPVIEIIDEVPEEDWIFWEMYWIEQFKVWGFNLKNGTKGGDGIKGYVYTEEDKKKMRGRVLSDETKEKMSKAKKGKPCPWSKVYGKDHHSFGVKRSEETKNKMKVPILQFDKKDNLIKEWNGLSDASDTTGINVGNISKNCQGKRKTAGGYIWRYK
jgi:group I intron endonuclease